MSELEFYEINSKFLRERYGNIPEIEVILKHLSPHRIRNQNSQTITPEERREFLRAVHVLWPTSETRKALEKTD